MGRYNKFQTVLAAYAALSAATTQASYRNSCRPLKAEKLPVNMDVKNVLSIYLSKIQDRKKIRSKSEMMADTLCSMQF